MKEIDRERYLRKLNNIDYESWNAMEVVTWIIDLYKDEYEKYGVDKALIEKDFYYYNHQKYKST